MSVVVTVVEKAAAVVGSVNLAFQALFALIHMTLFVATC